MNKIESMMMDNLSEVFEGMLSGALKSEGNKDVDLVSYTELLVDIPSESVNKVIYDIVKKYISQYGIDIFYARLSRVIKSGVSKISMIEDICIDEFYDKIYNYYLSI